jgi:arylsulfatase A-like enzyme
MTAFVTAFIIFALNTAQAVVVPGDELPGSYFPNFSREPFPAGAVGEVQTGRPIIWLVIDALRPQHLGCYGYERATTPALDRLADEGVIFTRFFANAPWTRPGTTCMLTGRIPSRHAVQCDWHKLPRDVGTVAQALKRAGYTTLAVVGNGNASAAFGLDKGFDVFEDTTKNWKGLPKANQVFDLALKHLEKHKGKQKVFLFMFVVDPHDPYKPQPPYDTMFLPGYKGKVIHNPKWEYKNKFTQAQRKKIVALYDGLIRFTDDHIKDLFAGLKRLGFYDQASIFVTADHGESMGEHGVYLHGHHLYETHIRIPLLIRAPWLKKPGKYSSAFLQQIDLFPTFCDLAGAKVPQDLRGLSIVGALRDRSSIPIPHYVIAEYKCYGIKRTAIRTRAYKLIYQQPADREVFMKHVKRPELLPSVSFDKETFQLYHVLKDPHEKTDIWPQLKTQEGQRLLTIIKREISEARPSSQVRDVDPDLVEQLRSMGYTW